LKKKEKIADKLKFVHLNLIKDNKINNKVIFGSIKINAGSSMDHLEKQTQILENLSKYVGLLKLISI